MSSWNPPSAWVGIILVTSAPARAAISGIAQPVGRRQKHLIVAGIEQHLKQVVNRLLAAVGDQNLLGGGLAMPLVLDAQLLGDELHGAQALQPLGP